ncbi:MAG: LamG domain-containing protein, partial [Acidobacteriota bacterium]
MQGPQSVLQFDGNGYVEIQDPFATDTDFTISLWVKPAAVDTGGYHGLLGKEGDWRRKPGLWLAPAQGGLAYDSYSPAPAGKRFAETLDEFFDASRWIHLAWVKEGTAYRFYRDGELLASREAPVRVYKKKSSYWIGRVDNFWHGQIAEVSFWSTARSEEEIQAGMHAAPSGEEPLLSGYWPLDEGEGEVANDRSSNANQGTIIGATWAQAELPAPPAVPEPTPPAEPEPVKVPPAKAEPAVSDDNLEPVVELAEGQYLEIQDPFENDVDFTLSLWVKPTDIDQVSWRGLVGQHGETHPKPSLGLAPGGGRLIYACCNRTGRHYSATLNDFFVEDEWVHLAWVKNGARFEIYRNGALFFTTRNAPQRFYKKKGTYWIGKVETSWRGQIAEMRLWKTARSPEQIRADVNHRLQGDEPDLAGYWPLDEGSGDVAHDKSANANHATLHGATWQRVPFPKAADPIAWPAASKVVSSSGLSEDDRSLIDKVEVALEDGLELFHWWQKTQREGSYAERFKILDPLARSKARFGFLDQATVAGRSVPVMGTVQELLYARPQMPPAVGDEGKAEHAEYMRAQIQEFMLRYFMRVANHHSPQFDPAKSLKTPPKWLRPFSWAVGGPADRRDWGYKQVYYKRTDGETGKFSESEQRTIVDVRELGESYEWIVLEVKLFDFALTFPPFTDHLPTMSVPARSTVHVVMSRDFVMDQTAA